MQMQVNIATEIKYSFGWRLDKSGQVNLRHRIRKIENLGIERKKAGAEYIGF
jgi:hypothetical protein